MLLGGFQALPALASTGGQMSYGEWSCGTNEAVLNWNNSSAQGVRVGSIFIGTYEQAMQQTKSYLASFDAAVRKSHPDYSGVIANAAYSCTLSRPYNH